VARKLIVKEYSFAHLTEENENARHENSAQRKLQGVENAGLENAAQEMQSWKMRDKSV